MKRTKTFSITLLALLVLMLTGCGKSEFGVTENTGKLIMITADSADKDAFFMTGSLEVADGEQIIISSELTKGSIRVEIVDAPDEQNMNELPEMDSEAIITANVSRTDGASGTVPPGNYLLRATCLEKATGTVRIEVKPAEPQVAETVESPVEDGQNPVMNFVGNYQCDRARALVECAGNEDAFITIDWGSSAWELTRWLIVGRLDTETLTIDYSGCSKTSLVHDENGEIKSQEAEYEDGTGTVVFREDGTFIWHEDQSESGQDMVFEWVPVTEDPDYYSSVTAMEKSEVEDFCLTVRNAFLDEDWEALAGVIRYPIVINGTELKTAEDFLAFMKDKTVAQGDRDAMAEETCHDMFFNGQGICFGSGEIWVVDPHYMTDEEPELQIIAFNGIVER